MTAHENLADRIESAAQPQTLREFGKLLRAIVACEAAGAVGALATRDASDFYLAAERGLAFGPTNRAKRGVAGRSR